MAISIFVISKSKDGQELCSSSEIARKGEGCLTLRREHRISTCQFCEEED